MIEDGATIWARKTIESDIFLIKPDKWFKIWFYIISKVKYKKMGRFDRGENFIKYEWITDATGATKHQIDHFLRWAKEAQMLATQKATRGMVVNVLQYSFYQDLENYESDNKSELKAKQKRNRSDTILKNDKNIKNDKKEIQNTCEHSSQEIADFINIFKSINPTINFGNKTTRKAVSDLFKQFGKEKAIEYANYAVMVFGKPYAPTITTPYELKTKLSKLAAYHTSEKNKKQKITVTKV